MWKQVATLVLAVVMCACRSESEGASNSGEGGASWLRGGSFNASSGGTTNGVSNGSSGGTVSGSSGGASSGGASNRGGASNGGASSAAGPSRGGASNAGASSGGGASALGGAVGSGGTGINGGATGSGGAPIASDAIYVSPSGVDTNSGTLVQPLYSLAVAAMRVKAGGTIYVRGGTFKYSATVALASSGSASSPTRILSYEDEKPILDFSMQPNGDEQRGILLTGSYWQIYGLEIAYAGDNGIKIEGSYNKIERCVFHHNGDTGLQLGFGHDTVNPDGTLCAGNEIINCDSYLNFDFAGKGGNADGFACKMHNGKGNVFRGCRAWHNSDDGWDLYETDWPVEISNSWSWHNGDQADFDAIYLAEMGVKMSSYSGNGNGIKLGGNGAGGSSKGTHVVKNCVAFNNNFRSKKGFDQNSHKGGVRVVNSLAWGNGYNFMFEEDPDSGATNEFINNVAFAPGTSLGMEFSSSAVLRNNSWQLPVTADTTDFLELSEMAAGAPRQADGSLPNNGFARLTAGSDLVDKGIDVQLPFNGSAPDLGAFEH